MVISHHQQGLYVAKGTAIKEWEVGNRSIFYSQWCKGVQFERSLGIGGEELN